MKNILKKQILWAIPLAFSLLTSSCSDYLDKLPENTVEVEGIDYTNKSNMYMPVSGVYATARGYLGSWSSYGCIIVRGDDVNKGGSPTDQIEYEYASKFQYDRLTTFWALSGLWGNCYYVVSTSNSALESLENYAKHLTSESDKQLNAQYAAEVRFFRNLKQLIEIIIQLKLSAIDDILGQGQYLIPFIIIHLLFRFQHLSGIFCNRSRMLRLIRTNSR